MLLDLGNVPGAASVMYQCSVCSLLYSLMLIKKKKKKRLPISVKPADSTGCPSRLAHCRTKRICTPGWPLSQLGQPGHSLAIGRPRPRPAPAGTLPLLTSTVLAAASLCLNQTGSSRDGLSSWWGGERCVRSKAKGRWQVWGAQRSLSCDQQVCEGLWWAGTFGLGGCLGCTDM